MDGDELKRVTDLRLRLSVNGEARQDVCVGADMIYRPVRALQALARFQHLDPGDLILTGPRRSWVRASTRRPARRSHSPHSR